MDALIQKIESRLRSLPVPVALRLPAGHRVGPDGAVVTLSFADWQALAIMAAGRIGALAEAFVESRVQIEGRMRDLMDVAAGLLSGTPVDGEVHWWHLLWRRVHSLAAHSLERDASQIAFHYDVSDDFYALWLDPWRVYSCAYFERDGMALAQAQEAKLDLICRKLMLRAGERFLDIGAGWGGLLLWAAEHYGVQATGITLSRNQHAHVRRLIEERGLTGRVNMELCDYRELRPAEPFDKIASVGMLEHVGLAHMVDYFRQIHGLLRPGGLVLNHGITTASVSNEELGAGMGEFIDKYIFPGGELLHVSQLVGDMARAGLEMLDTENLRPHYARTLWAWSDALEARLEEAARTLQASGDAAHAAKVLRAYRLYLAGSAMSFERGWLALHQMLATHPTGDIAQGPMRGAQSAYPWNREYMYRR